MKDEGFWLRELGDSFIGLWNFRQFKKKKQWCVTYQVNGFYYDTLPHKTAVGALSKAYFTMKRIKASSRLKDRACKICHK